MSTLVTRLLWLQVNYQGPYELTRLLEPVLIQCAPSRVVNLSSIMHRFTFIKKDPATFLKQRRGEPYPGELLRHSLGKRFKMMILTV